MQNYNYNKEETYFSIIKDKFESLERVKKLRAYQKHHPWAKVRYLAIGYALWWGLKIGAVAYGPTIIDNIKDNLNKDARKEKLEQTIDSMQINNNEFSEQFMIKPDTTIEEKIKRYESLESLIE
ncbi:hypothetical protein JXA48_01640 [Candidatus Woesearchaeota archaeon]|nr:hypothetical protein [Candidatus Woesearchaeota archaeon]